MIGQLVDGKYRVMSILGQGGMGTVYEAQHTGTGRRVALKVIAAGGALSPDAVSRFQREARAAGGIDTQHIVQVFDTGTDPESGLPFIVMEHLTGSDLDQLLTDAGALPVDVAMRIFMQAALGICRAHETDVVHRDIKPANVFLAKRDAGEVVVKVLDFGVAKFMAESAKAPNTVTLTGPGGVLGSPGYMSPEQAKALPTTDHRTDIWSLGVVFYEMLTGVHPFLRGSVGHTILAVCSEEPVPLSEAGLALPPEIVAIVERCLRKEATERFENMRAVIEALEPLLPSGWNLRQKSIEPEAIRAARERNSSVPISKEVSSNLEGTRPPQRHATVPFRPSELGSSSDFGKYRLLASLGQGGMGDVFLAIAKGPADLAFQKLVVIKRLKQALVEDPESLAMFRDEARIAARLNHPNLIQTHEVGQFGKQYFLTMEYLDGQPWYRVLQRANGRVPLVTCCRVIADVLAGLQCAHELADFDGSPLAVVHRDVSPHNVFVTYDGHVKVVDFGIAKSLGRAVETRTGVAKGKITYMAPEQAMSLAVDARSDVFSAGVMLWEAVTGRRYYKGMQEVQILQRLVTGATYTSARTVVPGLPAEIDRICARALAARPEDRYPRAADFLADLEELIDRLERERAAATTSGRSANRELGRLVAELFQDDRAERKAVIEQQLAEIANSRPVRIADAAIVDASTSDTPSVPRSRDTGTLGEAATAIGPLSTSGQRKRPYRLVGVTALVTALIGTALVARNLSRPSADALPSPSAEQLPVPQTPTVRISVRTSPADASMLLDGTQRLSNPWIGALPRDDKEHTLKVTAPGYQPLLQRITFEHDIDLDLVLTRAAEPSAATSASAAPSNAPPDVRGGEPATGPRRPRPKRPIEENPWQ